MNKKHVIVGVFVFLVILVIGGVWCWEKRDQNKKPQEVSEVAIDDNLSSKEDANEHPFELSSDLDTSNWKTYKNEEYGFEFKIPPEGRVEEFGPSLYSTSSVTVLRIHFSNDLEFYPVVVTLYGRDKKEDHVSLSLGDISKHSRMVDIGYMRYGLANSYYPNELAGLYRLYAWTYSTDYDVTFSMDESFPENASFRDYTPTFPQQAFFYEVLKSFRFTDNQ